ncbi:MAG: hypothetical protein OEM02_00725 [Desulfobulbaceae bacterium]|nr:hypothetical protein [Desulfobulbaceae bacterium]
MITKKELCDKIIMLYPDINYCGIDVQVLPDTGTKAWVVKLNKGNYERMHYLEEPDVNSCMEGMQCFTLGLEIAKLRKNIEEEPF